MQIVKALLDYRDQILRKWADLPSVARIYVVGLFVFAFGMVLVLVHADGLIINWAITAAMICLGIGFIREGYDWTVLRKDYPIFKITSGVLAVMAAAVATGASAITLADATGQDPGNFKSSIALLAPLAFVPVLALVAMVVSFCSLPLVLFFSLGKHFAAKEKNDNFLVLLMISRLLGFIALVAGAGQLLNPSTGLDAGLKKIAAYSAYLLDMHADPICSAIPGDRIVRLNDNLVIVGRITNDGPRFVRRSCGLAPEVTALPPPKSSGPQLGAATQLPSGAAKH